ncbi:D-aminoacyl-tRNA deacylase [Haploplasma axanthum]|uniref:D-aminoacyl-tRNA deacylase n=1 Tax=Haploplasma axanthum TaxID=29552 RepID=A0A449BEB8_HAPAX|nr:D-aminoacyl-tRNA deacylase [Haploplasma axanthum]VEU80803.1 D-tyrosyl-tRNA(Tyr) deacylase [Haploplasma axanthum]
MKLVIQRVKKANVKINNEIVGSIEKGFLVYLGIHINDTKNDVFKYVNKISNLRVFEDEDGKMNKDIKSVNGDFLIVSQFTLYGDAKKGNRPSFIEAARPEVAIPLYELFIDTLKNSFNVETGVFGADMQVESVNDGPVTIILENL